MSRLRDWWRTRRWPWWPGAMKVARDLDAEARAAFSDDQAVGLGRVAPAPGDSPATTEQVPVLLLEPRTAMLVANPETGEVTEGQVEAIIKAGLQRLTWPAALAEPAAGWTLQRTGDGIQLCDAQGGPWVRCAIGLEPRWVSAAVSLGPGAGVVRRSAGGPYSAQPGEPPLRPRRAADGTPAGPAGRDRGHRVRPLAHPLARPAWPGPWSSARSALSGRSARTADQPDQRRRLVWQGHLLRTPGACRRCRSRWG